MQLEAFLTRWDGSVPPAGAADGRCQNREKFMEKARLSTITSVNITTRRFLML
jgi:hypothetical protein